jgi:hypothetical protein
MGGYGSGRRNGAKRPTVEECRCLDVNHLHRKGALVPGTSSTMEWTRDGQFWGSIRVTAETNRLLLTYCVQIDDGPIENVTRSIDIIRVPWRFGGTRPYLRCPGVGNGSVCGRRVLKLYAAGRHFLCRHCCGLVYASQCEDGYERAIRRVSKTRSRVGGAPVHRPWAAPPFPARPKGMWRRTYERLLEAGSDAETSAHIEFTLGLERLAARLSRPSRMGRRAR